MDSANETGKKTKEQETAPALLAEITPLPAPQTEKLEAVRTAEKPSASGANSEGGNWISESIKAVKTLPSWLPSAEGLLPDSKGDKQASKAEKPASAVGDERVDKAVAGSNLADAQDALYLSMQGRVQAKVLTPGEYKNDDKSTYTVNGNGRIKEFTTAPSKDNPQGMTYKDITYDIHGDVLSYKGPSGHQFTRTTALDANGFGTWQCTDDKGRYANYSGSNSTVWRGKALVDEKGMHAMIGSGENRGALITRGMDGSFVESKYTQRDQHGPILQNKVTLADGTEVTRNERFTGSKMITNPQVLVKEPGNKDATSVPKGMEKIAEKVISHVADASDPVGNLSKTLQGLNNLRDASVTRRVDGKHAVDMHFYQATTAPAINANIRGFRPGPTRIDDDVKFTLSHSPNGIKVEDMEGFSGSVTGPRGRVRPSWSNGMHITKDQRGVPCVDIDSTVQGPFRMRSSSNRFYENNFPQNSPIRQLMNRPDALQEVAGALHLFQNARDLHQASIRRSAANSFDVSSSVAEAKHIPINQKLPDSGATVKSIDMAKTLSGSVSHDANGVRLSNLNGMTVKLDTALGEVAVTPKKVGLENNAQGVPIVKLEVDLKGTVIPIEIPLSKIRDQRRR